MIASGTEFLAGEQPAILADDDAGPPFPEGQVAQRSHQVDRSQPVRHDLLIIAVDLQGGVTIEIVDDGLRNLA
jgi:hypothetical protein